MLSTIGRYATLGLALIVQISGAYAGEPLHMIRDLQLARLFHPTANTLEAEQQGRVHTYSGLYDTDVERAMDEQFDRIDAMVFVRTVVTANNEPVVDDETGELLTEDDDC